MFYKGISQGLVRAWPAAGWCTASSGGWRFPPAGSWPAAGPLPSGLVHLLGLVLAQAAAQVGHIGLDAVLFVAVQLLFALGQGLVHLVGQHLGLVVQLQPLLAAAVLGLVGRGIRHSALDLVFGQVRAAGDGDVLLPAGAQILGRHLDHAVDVDIKGDLDLRLGGETAPDAVELELAQALVVAGKVALTLQHVDLHAGLHGACRGKDLALAGGDHAVAGDQRGGHAAQRLNGEGQRGHIHQHQTLCGGTGSTSQLAAALQQTALHGGTHGHALVRVQAVAGLAAQQLPHLALHGGHAGAAAHQQHLAQLAGGDAGIPQGVLHRGHGTGQQVTGHHLELRA